MDLTGHYILEADIEHVWSMLTDPGEVAACLPGCEAMERLDDERFQITMRVSVGPVGGTYTGVVSLGGLQRPNSFDLALTANAPVGFVQGEGSISLAQTGRETNVSIHGTVKLGGTIGRVAGRVMGGISKRMMDTYFGCMASRLAGRTTAQS